MKFNTADGKAPADVKMASMSAVIIRADGTREDVGVVAYYHKNPLKRWAWAVKKFFTGAFK